jgi:hypothetical protein
LLGGLVVAKLGLALDGYREARALSKAALGRLDRKASDGGAALGA